MWKLIVSLLFALVALTISSSGQLSTEKQVTRVEEKTCTFGEVYSREGWKVPGMRGATPKGNRASLQNFPGVFVTQLRPGKLDLTLPIFQCSPDISGRLAFRSKPVVVLELWRFDYQGKTFAYGAKYEPQTTSAQGTDPQRSLEFVSVFFYDVDGSGRHSIMKYPSAPSFFGSLEIPEWIKQNPAK